MGDLLLPGVPEMVSILDPTQHGNHLHVAVEELDVALLVVTMRCPAVVRVILGVHVESDGELLEVAHAYRLPALFTSLSQRQQQQGGEDCDDRDDHQQLDEGEENHIAREAPDFFHDCALPNTAI